MSPLPHTWRQKLETDFFCSELPRGARESLRLIVQRGSASIPKPAWSPQCLGITTDSGARIRASKSRGEKNGARRAGPDLWVQVTIQSQSPLVLALLQVTSAPYPQGGHHHLGAIHRLGHCVMQEHTQASSSWARSH